MGQPFRLLNNSSFLRLIDVCISFLWTTHLVVMFWRGTWNILDLYVLPNDMYLGSWISFCSGVLLCILVNSSLPILHRWVKPNQKIKHVIVSRVCIYLLSVGTVNQWRGVWNLLNHYTDLQWQSNLVGFCTAVVIMWFLRSSMTIVTPPMVSCCDLRNNFYYSEPRLRSKPSVDYWNYVVDQTFSQVIIHSLVVTVWRSLWNVINDIVYPDDFWISNMITWFGAMGFGPMLIALEKPASLLSKYLNKKHIALQLMFEEIYALLAITICISFWRGWWNVLEVKLIPGMLAGGVICHVIGYLGTTLTLCSGALYGFTILVDAEDPSGIKWSLNHIEYIINLFKRPTRAERKENGTPLQKDSVNSVMAHIS